ANLRRVVAVVVNDDYARGLALKLEAPVDACKLRERARDRLERQLQLDADGDCGERVVYVVQARHVQTHLAYRLSHPAHLKDGAELLVVSNLARGDVGLRRESVGDAASDDFRDDGLHVRVVQTKNRSAVERNLVDEIRKAPPH